MAGTIKLVDTYSIPNWEHISSMFQLTNVPAGFHDNPFPTYEWLRNEYPVCRQPDGSFILSRYSDLEMIYQDSKKFVSDKKLVFGPKFGEDTPLYEHHTTSLVFNDPPLHTRVRKAISGAMNPRAIATMEPGLVKLVDELLDEMSNSTHSDLIENYAGAIPVNVIGNLLNIPRGERKQLRYWSLAILGALEPHLDEQQIRWGNDSVNKFKEFLKNIVDDRTKNPLDPEIDVLTRLIMSEGGQLTDVELYHNCIFILNAGHETTTNIIGNALTIIDQNPFVRQQLLNEPELINTAVDEFLRLESPNQFGNRLSVEPIELHGTEISPNTNLHLCIGAANRDPNQFESPNEIRLNRRPNKHLAFASGIHKCVGLTLARMETRIAVGRFLKRFPNFSISNDSVRSNRIRFRGFSKLPVNLN